jgi:hypothetical protein
VHHKDFGPSTEYPIFETSHQFHIFRDQLLVAMQWHENYHSGYYFVHSQKI